ncbi:MAG: carboxypeptidase regulatory-like domain-containing protein [Pyrinomonadaceae bacterium]|nr:carboxypeptidase regulatory-like domain-containing protein [Pyrinomonadaceae bacterium]
MKIHIMLHRRFIGLMIILMVGAATAFGQEFRGAINGTVSDPNGAAVAGATVTVKNVETNITNTVMTNDEGSYTVPFLIPGTYTVSATSGGFKTSSRDKVTVKVDDRLSIDFVLEIGASAEVSVMADAEILERSSVTVGTSVSQRQIEELPLAEGAPYTLATQAPGVVYTGDPNFQGPTANGNLAGFRTNGAGGNQINLDGSPNLAYSGQVAFTPPSDAVQEFKVQTNAFDAQNGFTAGSTVNVALKSGTNKLHGSANYFDRSKNRTANNFFNNRLGRERPDRKYNRYGFMLNGPVYIPKLYDGKDKTFFLFSYERQKDNVAQPTTYSVPTMKMRNGDFTELIVDPTNIASTANTVIYNPFSGVLSGSNVVRTSFGCPTSGPVPAGSTCNIIPAGSIYAPALAFLKLFPAPNQGGLTNNFITDQNLIRPYRSYLVKIDHNFNANNRIFGKWYHSRNTEDRYNLEGTPDSITRGFENRRNNGGNVDYTSTLSGSFILDIRGSWNQFRLLRYQDGQPTAAELGFTGIPSSRQANIFPRFDFRNYMTLGSQRADYNDGQNRPFDMFTVQPTLTQIWGNHTLKYGYDFRRLHERFNTAGYAAGRFTIDGTYTAPASNSSATLRNAPGRDIAAFILGVPPSGSIDNPTEYDTSSIYHGFFVHDDYRYRSNLTFNIGLRYELESGVREKDGRIVVDFDRAAPSPIAAAALANFNSSVPVNTPIGAFQALTGGLLFAADSSQANQSTDKNNFQPRLGFSWGVDNKTVIRGGFGIFTAPFQIGPIFQPGFSTPTSFTPSTNNGLTFLATLANPFPTGVAPSPGAAQGLMTFTGRDMTSANATGPTSTVLTFDRKNANYSRFIIGVQRELPYSIGMEATYLYSRGSDLAVSRELNAIPVQYLNNFNASTDPTTILAAITSVNSFLNASVSNPMRGLIPDGGAWNATTIQRRRLLVPFPQFGNLAVTEYNGTSDYQSLSLQFVKRFTDGFSLNGSYTFAREHQKTQYLNPQDIELTDIVSPTERPHRWTVSSIYELPFGKNRKYGSEWHPAIDAILGGWQMQGVYEWQSGEPLQFGNVYFNGDPASLRNLLGKKDPNGLRYGIDVPAFALSGFFIGGIQSSANVPGFANNYTSGSSNTLRTMPLTLGQFRNQRFLKFDLGMSKNFRIREGMRIQIRVEAINLLNNPYFSGLNLDPTSASFGLANTQRQPPRDIQIGGRFTF